MPTNDEKGLDEALARMAELKAQSLEWLRSDAAENAMRENANRYLESIGLGHIIPTFWEGMRQQMLDFRVQMDIAAEQVEAGSKPLDVGRLVVNAVVHRFPPDERVAAVERLMATVP